MKYNKLVRDNIPEIIRKKGGTPVMHTASDEEYVRKLTEKLQEEMTEFIAEGTTEELADILEVVYALAELKGTGRDKLETLRRRKALERGEFKKRIILEES